MLPDCECPFSDSLSNTEAASRQKHGVNVLSHLCLDASILSHDPVSGAPATRRRPGPAQQQQEYTPHPAQPV